MTTNLKNPSLMKKLIKSPTTWKDIPCFWKNFRKMLKEMNILLLYNLLGKSKRKILI